MAFPDVDVFTVTSACRQLEGAFGYDTDGAAIGFGIPASTSPPCSGVDAEREASLIEALRAVESWRVLSDDRIELRGDTLIVLRRDPAHEDLGGIRTGLFIQRKFSDVKMLGSLTVGRMDGDGRGWSSGSVDCVHACGCLTIDFDRKRVSAVVIPTCGVFPTFPIPVDGCVHPPSLPRVKP